MNGLYSCMCFISQIMPPDFFLFEVHYGGRFSRQFRCSYVSGNVDVYDEP